jgi:histidinol-phosphatase (PHP family)
MFDFHLHSRVSCDSQADPWEMVRAAEAAGLKEICFTDHLDYDPKGGKKNITFTTESYNDAYDCLHSDRVKIRRGFEFGMLPDNVDTFRQDLERRHFDFVIGSLHYCQNEDVYFPPFWETRTVAEAEQAYLEDILSCVRAHDGFDVLGHLTYLSKAIHHPARRPISLERYGDLVDEILKVLVQKGKGMEMNTSGKGVCGVFLPEIEFFKRFKELGGEIVTVGSDAHGPDRVGQHTYEAVKLLGDVFGYVCTFEDRKPIFHKV